MFETQKSSKPRLKNDTLGNNTLSMLYEQFDKAGLNEFRGICQDVIQQGGGKQKRKDEIIAAIHATNNKAVVLKKTQDFILAGMGLGV